MLSRRIHKVVLGVSIVFILINLYSLQYGYQFTFLQIASKNNHFKQIQTSSNLSASLRNDGNWKGNVEVELKQSTIGKLSGIHIAKNVSSENGTSLTRHLHRLSSKEVPKLNKARDHVLNYGSLKHDQVRLPSIVVNQMKRNVSDNSLRETDNPKTLTFIQSSKTTHSNYGNNVSTRSHKEYEMLPTSQNGSNFLSSPNGGPNILSHTKNRPNILSPSKNGPNVIHSSPKNARISVRKVGTVRSSTCNGCFAHNYKYIINNENVCRNISSNQNIDLIIMILTTHANFAARNALRETWLSCSNKNTANIRYVFLLGEIKNNTLHEKVVEENKKYNDIIKEDFTDSYLNLTYKTIMGYKWIVNHCSEAKYVIKTDDDVFINIPNILKYIMTEGETLDNNLAGSCGEGAPNRKVKSKWHASVKAYKETKYPGFCSGTAYVTSMKLATKIYNISSIIPFFHLEDVYIGLCLQKVGGYVINLRGFNRGRPKLDTCLYKGDNFYTSHLMTPSMLYSVWKGVCKSTINRQP